MNTLGKNSTLMNSALRRFGGKPEDTIKNIFPLTPTQQGAVVGGRLSRHDFFGFWAHLSFEGSIEPRAFVDALFAQISTVDQALLAQVRIFKESIGVNANGTSKEINDKIVAEQNKLIQQYSPTEYKINGIALASIYNTIAFLLLTLPCTFEQSRLVLHYNTSADGTRDPIRWADSPAYKNVVKLLAVRSQEYITDEGILSPLLSMATHVLPQYMRYNDWLKLPIIDEADVQSNECGFAYSYLLAALNRNNRETLPSLLKCIIDKCMNLPQQMKMSTLQAEQSMLSLFFMLRNVLAYSPYYLNQHHIDVLSAGMHILKTMSLWHQPYGHVAEQMISLLQHEIITPGFVHKLAIFKECLSIDCVPSAQQQPTNPTQPPIDRAALSWKNVKPIFYLHDSQDQAASQVLSSLDLLSGGSVVSSIVSITETPHASYNNPHPTGYYPPAPVMAQLIISTFYSLSKETQFTKEQCESLRCLKTEQLIHIMQKLTYLEEKYYYAQRFMDMNALVQAQEESIKQQWSYQTFSQGHSITKSSSSMIPPESLSFSMESPDKDITQQQQQQQPTVIVDPLEKSVLDDAPTDDDKLDEFIKFKDEILALTSIYKGQTQSWQLPCIPEKEYTFFHDENPAMPIAAAFLPPVEHFRVPVDLKTKMNDTSTGKSPGYPAAHVYDRLKSIIDQALKNSSKEEPLFPAKDVAVLNDKVPIPPQFANPGLIQHQISQHEQKNSINNIKYNTAPLLPLDHSTVDTKSKEHNTAKLINHYKREIRFVIAGNDRLLQHVITAYYWLQVNMPRAFEVLDLKFYLLPVVKNGLANYLGHRDLWYHRHIYAPFRSPFPYLIPWFDEQPTPNETTVLGLPAAHLREQLVNYIREAQHTYRTVIYKLEGRLAAQNNTSTGGPTTHNNKDNSDIETIPFIQRLDIGLLPAIEQYRATASIPPSTKTEDILEDRRFIYNPPELIVKYTKVDLLGRPKPEIMDDAVPYQAVTLTHVPRKQTTLPEGTILSAGANTQPHTTTLELFAQPAIAKLDKTIKKRNTLLKDGRQYITEVTITAASSSQPFRVLADGILLGPFKSIRICPAQVMGRVAKFPIQTFFPLHIGNQ